MEIFPTRDRWEVSTKIEVEELPQLEKGQLKPFTEITSLELSTQIDEDEDEDDDIDSLFGDSKTTEPVWENFVSQPNDKAGWPSRKPGKSGQ